MVYYYEYFHFIDVKTEATDLRLQEPGLKPEFHSTNFHWLAFKYNQIKFTTGRKIKYIMVGNRDEITSVWQRSSVIRIYKQWAWSWFF